MLTPRLYIKNYGSISIYDYQKNTEIESLSWNGSHIGDIEKIEEIDKVLIGRYLSISSFVYNNKKIICLTKNIESKLPAIFDELKPYFGLTKIGTHTFTYKKDLMIAYKPYFKNNEIVIPQTLNNFQSKNFEEQIRLIFTFRKLFGITDTHEKSIIINNNQKDKKQEIISFLEPGSVVINNPYKSVLSENIIRKWFDENLIEKSQKTFLYRLICYNREFPESSLIYYRQIISEVIKSIDPDLITYSDLFYDRLCNQL